MVDPDARLPAIFGRERVTLGKEAKIVTHEREFLVGAFRYPPGTYVFGERPFVYRYQQWMSGKYWQFVSIVPRRIDTDAEVDLRGVEFL